MNAEVAHGVKTEKGARRIIGMIVLIAGLALAFFAGIFLQSNAVVVIVLLALGIIIGALNITSGELTKVMLAAIALIVVATAGFETLNELAIGLGDAVNGIINYLARLMAPAAVIAAVRLIIIVGRPGDK
jgi:hypothetical protein